ncbi:MAG: sulfite exporter TauE/SafE family protein [Candidatus Omnitrophica bacterium CG_4_9_14_0_2_um_filter_42_8]|nr:MAG: permease [Candidatus Omnitrophica bacterium CG22_combo_CG10-13_8_21_14_all_43_16]PJC47106.1 MAG: sulfite exporter TauE/SafE family protein [Candidatus Omnitrophica bacterium CG_4_9_14_0_2_um_filter_42_8]
MDIQPTYWYILPISIIFASIAATIGIGGATFFSPFFMIVLKLNPEVAIGTALITEVFGFTSAILGYSKKRLIDYKLAFKVLVGTIPMAVLGVFLSHAIRSDYLKLIFGIGMILLAIKFLQKPDVHETKLLNENIKKDFADTGKTTITTRSGEIIKYTVCNVHKGRVITSIGGFFVGLISTGLGELNDFFFLRTCRVPSKIATGTSVLIVAITALAASLGHFKFFMGMGETVLTNVANIIIFTIPGVIIGGQLGAFISSRMKSQALEFFISILFIAIGAITLLEVATK